MEGDKVRIEVELEERLGKNVVDVRISDKPQFMLKEEYDKQLIDGMIEAIKSVCQTVYPNNKNTQEVLARAMANQVSVML